MRRALAVSLEHLMTKDPSVYVLTSDTGFHVFDDLRARQPMRFINVGIAEASMIGMAAGLAMSGKTVFTYAIAPFAVMRCLEQIRNDLCYAKLPVKMIGVGGGLVYGPAGATHHAIEDIALMCALPEMTVICPADGVETAAVVHASLTLNGPCYIRIGKTGEPCVHENAPVDFRIGKAIEVAAGTDAALIATGNMVTVALDVRENLRKEGVHATVISMHTVKPLDEIRIVELASRCRVLATLEEHTIVGGLGSRVADCIARNRLTVDFIPFAIPDCFVSMAGSQEFFRVAYGLTSGTVAHRLMEMLRLR